MNGRTKDLCSNFGYIIRLAIEQKVDFILHSGNLFQTLNPSYAVMIRTIKELQGLSYQNIPFIVISGDHDSSSETLPIEMFQSIPFCYPVTTNKTIQLDIHNTNVFIHCFSFTKDNSELQKKFLEIQKLYHKKTGYHILLLHSLTKKIKTSSQRSSMNLRDENFLVEEKIPTFFHYIGTGGLKTFLRYSHPLKKDLPICFPGSTSWLSVSDAKDSKVALLGTFQSQKCFIKPLPLPDRKIQEIEVLLQADWTFDELLVNLQDHVNKVNKQNVFLRIRLKGELSHNVMTKLLTQDLKNLFPQHLALHVDYQDIIVKQESGRLNLGDQWLFPDEEELLGALQARTELSEKEIMRINEKGKEFIFKYHEETS